jgi:molecular chaperone GrpE (heat shock protein)
MELGKSEERIFGEIALVDVSKELAITPEYKQMIERINDKLPAIRKDSENFYKSASQFKGVTLDITDLTPMGSLKHILAVIDRTRSALEESHINVRRKQIELKQKTQQYDEETDPFKKELLWIDIVELNVGLNSAENFIKGAVRKLSFFTTQYEAIMDKLGVDEITEEDYELNESRHHIMTAMKQALNAARTRGGVIDEGNHIYLFEMGINGAVAQAEILAYLNMEQELLTAGKEPTHEMTIKWLEACADKFADCGRKFAEYRGFITLDKKSLAKEVTDGKENS